MIRRPPRSTLDRSSAASDVYKRQLYYRLSVFPLQLPSLRERADDVVIIAETLVEKLSRQMGRRAQPLSSSAAVALRSYSWPGNVRDLRNVIERALITSGEGPLRFVRVLPDAAAVVMASAELSAPAEIMVEDRIRQIERINMIAALDRAAWRVGGEGGAAGLIGISPSTFKSRMKALGIRRPT